MTVAFDFETHGIESRPDYPPRPVGLAYAIEKTGKSGYIAWGHPCNNNGTPRQAAALLHDAWRGKYGPMVFHNCNFDIDVATTYFDLEWPDELYDDTLFLAFLDDPRAATLSLKPLALKYLNRKAGERDELYEWIAANVRIDGKKIAKSKLGAYICMAPGDLVGKYATADATMTLKLFRKLEKIVRDRGMRDAYEREIALVPTTLEMERTGLRVDRPGLVKLRDGLESVLDKQDFRIRKILKLEPGFNLDSPDQLGQVLVDRKKLSRPTLTPTGKQSTAKDTLIDTCNDPILVKHLMIRSITGQYLSGFVRSWIARAERTGGYIQPRFNQVRDREGDGKGGTRSGRFSSSLPNFQNVPANVEDAQNPEALIMLIDELASVGILNFTGLREYFLPDPGKYWVVADYSQQELRILAHFEGGELMHQYLRDPKLDVHKWVQQKIKDATGREFSRKFVKTCVFMQIYGGGAKKLAAKLKIPVADAYALRAAVLGALPGVKTLMDTTKGPIVTWGGRHYDVEEPYIAEGDPDSEGEVYTFEYRQLNYRIQGSAADCTKQGMLNVAKALPECRIALQVHDEIAVMADRKDQAEIVAKAMCDVEFAVPMVVEPKLSKVCWGRAA